MATTHTERQLEDARILFVGLEPWGLAAAAALALVGVGELYVVDDRPVSAADASAIEWGPGITGELRHRALTAHVARCCPSSRVVATGLPSSASGGIDLPGVDFDLVIVASAGDEFGVLAGVGRAAHHRRLPSMAATVQGGEAVIGPAVVPGSTACWACFHYRRLAALEDPWQAAALDRAFRFGRRVAGAVPLDPTAVAAVGSLLALEARQLCQDTERSRLFDSVLVQDLASLATSVHPLVSLPWCDVCGGAARRPASSSAAQAASEADEQQDGGGPWPAPPRDGDPEARLPDWGTPAEVRDRLSPWVDSRLGIVRSVRVEPAGGDRLELPVTAAADLSWWGDPGRGRDIAGGKGLTAGAAMVGAVAEALERYSASRIRPSDLKRARLDELPPEARLDPRELGLYEDEQYERPGFPHARFDPDRPHWWARGWWVPSWQPAWVPALATHVDLPVRPEEDFVQVTSNGLGAGVSPAAAARAAAFELIERDALMMSWLTRRPGRELVVGDDLGREVTAIVRELEQRGACIRLLALSAGVHVPVVACLGLGDGVHWPSVTLSASAGPDLVSAARRAILEQGHAGPEIRRALRAGRRLAGGPEAVRTPEDHALLFAPPGRSAAVEFLFAGSDPPARIGDLEEVPVTTVEECGRRMSEAGIDLAVADVTSPDLGLGPWRVVRALGTQTQSIHFGFGMERAANPRLSRQLDGPLSRLPHPFA